MYRQIVHFIGRGRKPTIDPKFVKQQPNPLKNEMPKNPDYGLGFHEEKLKEILSEQCTTRSKNNLQITMMIPYVHEPKN